MVDGWIWRSLFGSQIWYPSHIRPVEEHLKQDGRFSSHLTFRILPSDEQIGHYRDAVSLKEDTLAGNAARVGPPDT